MLPPALVAPVVAAILFGSGYSSLQRAGLAALAALLVTVLVGWPLLFWAFDNGHTRSRALILVGAAAGAVPMAGALLSGIIGLYMKSSDVGYVRWVLGHGAAIPYLGTIPWSSFATGLALAVATGMATAALVFRSSGTRRHAAAR